jgi:hypothetical protein
MSNKSDNIEERLIPYIEGVLNESEQQEVAKAIQADANLAREVDELKVLIGDLRGAFASGMNPKVEGLSVREVVEMAAHDGRLDTMTGTSEQKARLFCDDRSLEEYHLLRGLSEDMQQTTLPMADVPPMPDSLLAEIARYKSTPKVVQFAPKLTPKAPEVRGGFFGLMDRLDPKPLMATAAAFVLLSLGFHVYNTPANSTMGDQQVAFGQTTATPATTPVSEVAVRNGKNVVEPTGVTVFTSGDRGLLKEQAEKLLAKKVRYTVTQDRILVSENEVAQARAVLWGDEDAGNVAMVEEKSMEEQLLTPRDERRSTGGARAPRPDFAQASPGEGEAEEFVPPPIKHYDLRSTPSASGRKGQDGAPKSYSADEQTDQGEGLGKDSAFQRTSKKNDEPNWSDPNSNSGMRDDKSAPADLRTGTASASEAAELKGASKSEREKILKAMALGQAKEAPSPPPQPKKVSVGGEEDEPVRQEISRARSSQSQEENRTAPVANVITADSVLASEVEQDGDITEESGAVASRGSSTNDKVAKAKPSAARPSYAPGSASDDGVVTKAKGDVDLRMVSVRSAQASVARRYNVVLSVESVGDSISVYVRPNKELSKAELDELRIAIRADLGLSAADTIVFR